MRDVSFIQYLLGGLSTNLSICSPPPYIRKYRKHIYMNANGQMSEELLVRPLCFILPSIRHFLFNITVKQKHLSVLGTVGYECTYISFLPRNLFVLRTTSNLRMVRSIRSDHILQTSNQTKQQNVIKPEEKGQPQ